MSATTIFVIGIIAASLLAAIGVFVVAIRRGPSAPPLGSDFARDAKRKEDEPETGAAVATEPEAVATPPAVEAAPAETAAIPESAAEQAIEEAPVATEEAPEPVPDPILERVEISKEEFAATRRKFLNRAVIGLFGGAFLGGQALAYLAFLWPKLKGGFGTPINAGNLNDLRTEVAGEVINPKFIAAAQSWIVPFDPNDVAGSSFEGLPVVVGGGSGEVGLMALWQRCVHLGCRVPSCVPSQGFECPCHGSRYNFHGEYEAGPAPRNLDRFEVSVDDEGNLIVNTGSIFQTARARNKTIIYPQGPSCI